MYYIIPANITKSEKGVLAMAHHTSEQSHELWDFSNEIHVNLGI